MYRRIFSLQEILDRMPGRAGRTVLYAGEYAVAGLWRLEPDQEIHPHRHPGSDDVWVVLAGEGECRLEQQWAPPCRLAAGMVAVAGPQPVEI